MNLLQLLLRGVGQSEHDAVDTVRVTDEMIVADVVAVVTRELPDTQLTGAWTIDTSSRFAIRRHKKIPPRNLSV